MTYKQLIKHYGTFTKAQVALGFKQSGRLSNWKTRGIPKTYQQLIELKTGGALKAKE